MTVPSIIETIARVHNLEDALRLAAQALATCADVAEKRGADVREISVFRQVVQHLERQVPRAKR